MVMRTERTDVFVELQLAMNTCRSVSVPGADLYGDKAGISLLALAGALEVLRNVTLGFDKAKL